MVADEAVAALPEAVNAAEGGASSAPSSSSESVESSESLEPLEELLLEARACAAGAGVTADPVSYRMRVPRLCLRHLTLDYLLRVL